MAAGCRTPNANEDLLAYITTWTSAGPGQFQGLVKSLCTWLCSQSASPLDSCGVHSSKRTALRFPAVKPVSPRSPSKSLSGSSRFELGEVRSLNQSHDRNVYTWWPQAKSPCSEPQHLQHLPRRKPECVIIRRGNGRVAKTCFK